MTRLPLTRRAAPNHLSDRSPAYAGGRNFPRFPAVTQKNADAFAYGVMASVSLLFIAFGLSQDTPEAILAGFFRIITSTNILITDYVALGGIGTAFINAGLLMFAAVALIRSLKVEFRGITVAAVFLMGSFGLFGKNIYNVWPIIFGTWLYARLRKESFARHVYTALFATSLAPIVTEFAFVLHLPGNAGQLIGICIGVSVGLIIPPLAEHLKAVHKGYSLYNVGFTAGILGTVYVSLLRSYGYQTGFNMIWSDGNDSLLLGFLLLLFCFIILVGLFSGRDPVASLQAIFRQSGHAGEDFIALGGLGASLVNIGLNGLIGTAYVLLVRGPLNGPTIGGILTIAGFGACGKHARNIIPVLLGVILGSVSKVWSINEPAVLLAALFGTSLAPISGRYGWAWGAVAGFLNSSVALCSGALHGGMSLYNTGFSAGIVAAFLVPLMGALARKDTPKQVVPDAALTLTQLQE